MFLKLEEHSIFFEKSLLFPNIVDRHVQHIPSASAAYNVAKKLIDFRDIIANMFHTFQQAIF